MEAWRLELASMGAVLGTAACELTATIATIVSLSKPPLLPLLEFEELLPPVAML